ncbi:Ribose ABC transport system, ATP-binding protein RbsA (TC 3.A.1.2.1) [Leucobacter sp. 7(1)]|uniref:sugar ABC transporter ATP-binding protein n=1 Tax=Leucobacter sp. 7(1) TaxID=1255613 RepID=UPI00097EAD88|nr:sugar ABC transporter ATP-binding protein [Leucobacter sp. 7(1)]SJN09714.1 Ribose ABC transport system, ATP-binding protein RbsA (TC 3.A.1.2.1) [Leucobacter sp. 7(1)]
MGEGAALSIRNLSKTFPGQRALQDFHIEVERGQIHALVGENGSGKSTFIKSLSGYHEPDPGAEIIVNGVTLTAPYAPPVARKHGIAFIHQDLGLVADLTVAENLALPRGFHTNAIGGINWKREQQAARELLVRFGHGEIDPNERLGNLPLATQTIVAVARALADNDEAHVIVLDEPTASMPHAEVERLLESVRALAASGVGIIYVSHRLEEIFQLCDRVTAIRDGRNVGTHDVADLDYDALVELIVGDSLIPFTPADPATVRADQVVVRFEGLTGGLVQEASGEIRAGEIVGVTGLLGSGAGDLGKLLFGALPQQQGSLAIGGDATKLKSPRTAMDRGVSYVPGDRQREGIFRPLSLTDNAMITDLRRFFRGGWRRRAEETEYARDMFNALNVRPNDPDRPIYSLSGGNAQKVVLAKWLNLDPKFVIFDEPVQGVDIGAKTEVYNVIGRTAAAGAAVMIVSTELDDIARLCHRILVMREGRVYAELTGADMNRARISELTY